MQHACKYWYTRCTFVRNKNKTFLTTMQQKGRRRTNRYSDEEILAIQEAATRMGIVDGNPVAKFTRKATVDAVRRAGVKWPGKTAQEA